MKTGIDMFLLNIEDFLCDFRGSRYLHLKKVFFFVGHPVYLNCYLHKIQKEEILSCIKKKYPVTKNCILLHGIDFLPDTEIKMLGSAGNAAQKRHKMI